MHTGGLGGFTDGASVERRPTKSTEAKVPARQQQYARLFFRTVPTPPTATFTHILCFSSGHR